MRQRATRERRSWGNVLAALLLVATIVPPGDAGDGFDAARARYEAYKRRPSFFMRTRGRVALARTKDLRALRLLARDYARPEEPKEATAHLLATLATGAFGRDPAAVPDLAAWRARSAQALDAWLWHRVLDVETRLGGESAMTVAGDPKLPLALRAAALQAAADTRPRDALERIPLLLTRQTEQGALRGVLPEACAAILRSEKRRKGSPEFRLAAEGVIRRLDEKGFPERSKLVISRYLAATFDTQNVGTTATPWLRELAAAEASGGAPTPAAGATNYANPTFFGLKALGKRIVYVIDASDSMLAPLTSEERERLLRPVTPPAGETPRPKGRKRLAEEIDWKKVATRFDGAREVLKHSIRTLPPGVHFAVVLFGDRAFPLAATPRLLPNTPKNVQAVVAGLDGILPEQTQGDREHPFGRLRGATNLHGGLCRAFQLTTEGLLPSGEYVDLDALENGCDTVFVLSDGEPTWDDWPREDARDPEDQAGDPESDVDHANVPRLEYMGPFAWPGVVDGFDAFLPDVRRLNLLRNAEIHCVALGEAPDDLLGKIAAVGLGKVERVGKAPEKGPR